MTRALVWGDLIDDIIVRPDAPIRPDTDTTASIVTRPGGSAANVAAWMGSLRLAVDFVGRVGAADLERHRSALLNRGVTPHLIGDASEPTGTIVILLDQENRRTMLTQRGANLLLTPADIPDPLLGAASVMHFTGYSVFNGAVRTDASTEHFQELIRRAHELETAVSVDPGSAGYLDEFGAQRFLQAVAGATVLLPNEQEAAVLTGLADPAESARELGRLFPVVVVTAGADGAFVVDHGRDPVHRNAEEVGRVDSTGAGDAFNAGFLDAWLRGADPVEAASAAAVVAAGSLELIGGRPE